MNRPVMAVGETRDPRRTTRHAPRSPVAVVDVMSGELLGFVMDLSAGGMKLMATEPLVADALYQVQFELLLGDAGMCRSRRACRWSTSAPAMAAASSACASSTCRGSRRNIWERGCG